MSKLKNSFISSHQRVITKPGIFLGKRAKSQALALPLLRYLTT